jgi:hypothetical protein
MLPDLRRRNVLQQPGFDPEQSRYRPAPAPGA